MIQKFKLGLSLIILCCLTVVSTLPSKAVAETFNPSQIIDDSVFDNKNAMTAAQIDAFLNTFSSSCLSTNNHFTAPDPVGYNQTQGYIFGGNVSGGTAIAHAAQAYDLNPQVLLATLQKEQSLVSGGKGCYPNTPDPNSATPCDLYGNGRIYNCTNACPFALGGGCIPIAVGYGCPGRCDAAKEGFTNQIIRAAWLLKFSQQRAKGNINWAIVRGNWDNSDDRESCYGGPMTKGNWQVCPSGGTSPYDGLYKPKDGNTIQIMNGATAALYYYTPFLSGNQSFFNIFTGWFGSTKGTPFFQLPGSVKTYMLGANNTYYYVPSPDIMKAYGYTTVFTRISQESSSFVTSMTLEGDLPLIARFEGNPIFAVSRGNLHHFSTSEMFSAYGYAYGQEATLPAWVASYLPQTTAMSQVLKQADNTTVYYVNSGKAKPFCSREAFSSLGSPAYSSQASVTLDHLFALTLSTEAPIMATGDMTHAIDSNKYGIWDGSRLTFFDSTVAQLTKIPSCPTNDALMQQLPTSSVVLSNLAGNSAGNFYIIDGTRKLNVPNSSLSTYNKVSSDFVTVPDAFLNNLSSGTMSPLYRVSGTDPVYLVVSGNAYHIPSADDLRGLGYDFSKVISVNKQTNDTFPLRANIYKPGRLIRIGTQDQVYMLDSGFVKHLFSSSAVFLNYGYSWGDVISVTSASLQDYSLSTTVSQYAKDSSGNYWLVDNGTRHQISSTLAGASFFNVDTQPSITLSTTTLTKVSIGKDITKLFRAGTTDTVYKIENGQKRAFQSTSAFLSQGNNWNDVISLSPSFVATLPLGTPIN